MTPSAAHYFFIFVALPALVRSMSLGGTCRSIEYCSPDYTGLDVAHYLNKTVEIKCFFRGEMPLSDINWTLRLGKHEVMALNMDSEVLPPFAHDYIPDYTSPSNPQPHTVSILRVPLLNASFFTNYTISLISEGCFHTVSIGLRERALKYMDSNEATASRRLGNSFLLVLVASASLVLATT